MELTATAELEKCVVVAKDAGCPDDQVRNFLSVGYIPFPKQWCFHAAARECDDDNGPTDIGLGGARGPGKTTAAFNQVCLDDCVRAPGIKFLFLRSLQKSASESFEELIYKELKIKNYDYSSSKLTLKFDNGSHGLLGGYKNDDDISKYIGQQYDIIVIEEATTLKPGTLNLLKGSLRSDKKMLNGNRWRPRTYNTTNPGGLGHMEFKEMFVEPWRRREEKETRFIPCNYKDNPLLNKEYVEYLEALTGDLGLMWREGEWDVFEGQAFSSWKYAKHVIDPFTIPAHWIRIRAVDWGYAKPFCCLWAAKDPDTGRYIVYRELYAINLNDQEQARSILDHTLPSENILMTFADPSMWSTKTAGEIVTTTADEYRAEGVILTKADNDRLSGKRKVDRMLADMPDGMPGVQIFKNCTNLIRTLPALPYDKVRVEDVDTDAEDHAFDSLKYLFTNVRDPSVAKPVAKQRHVLQRARYM